MIPYLPRTVAIGDKLRLVPYALDKQDNGSGSAPHALTGQVIYIHPQRRFATVRFPLEGYDGTGYQVDKSFRECWPIMPNERRLAHAEPKREGNHGKPGPTIRQHLQAHDWSDMTSDQIATALGTNTHTVTNAIYVLAKRGIDIPYKKRWKAKKAAAGSSSPDSGKEK
ncbi:MAG: hypothetical protein LIO95_10085 [Clostridiales bacterium]|nr:hypothetical protein [Clostridiales bacterium]